IADSAQFSTAITELSAPAYVGTALTTQTCAGFALTMLSIWLIPPLVTRVGWRWAFAALAIGPALGIVAMGRLRTLPEASRLAGGRRWRLRFIAASRPAGPQPRGGLRRARRSDSGLRQGLQTPQEHRALTVEPIARRLVAVAERGAARLEAHRRAEERRLLASGLDQVELGARM